MWSVQRRGIKKVPLCFVSSITGRARAPKLETSEVNWAPYRILDPLTPKATKFQKKQGSTGLR